MPRFWILILIFTVFILSTVYIYQLVYYQGLQDAFDQRRLNYAINNAADAAVDEVVQSTADLGMDYADWERLKVNPDVALEEFISVFLRSYDMMPSTENRALVETVFLKTMVIAMYDGYYVGTPTTVDSETGDRRFIFQPKWPYIYTDESTNLSYALNLSYIDSKIFNAGVIQKVPAPVEKLEQIRIINTSVSDALMNAIGAVKDQQAGSTFATYIPEDMGVITRTNPIRNTTVIVYMDEVDFGWIRNLQAFAIGGSSIAKADFLGGFYRDGGYWYNYLRLIDPSVVILEVFETPIEAASKGYYRDVENLD